jgi:UDP-N-acetylmuramoyl-tripeptide--D-alanyl-D-alanine ligase
LIRVANTSQALQDLGAAWRRSMAATVIGITGSCGKTSTKNILRHVLEKNMATKASERSFAHLPARCAAIDERARHRGAGRHQQPAPLFLDARARCCA